MVLPDKGCCVEANHCALKRVCTDGNAGQRNGVETNYCTLKRVCGDGNAGQGKGS